MRKNAYKNNLFRDGISVKSAEISWVFQEELKIRISKSKKDREHNGQMKKGQTTIYKTLHIKLKIE